MGILRLAPLVVVGVLGLAGCTTSTVAGQASSHPVLRFRPVVKDPTNGMPLMTPAQQPGATGDTALRQDPAVATDPAKQQAAFDALDCSRPDPLHAKDDPAKPLVTCDKEGQMKYILGPSFLDAGDIRSATAGFDQGQWVITLKFTPSGAKTWSDYTGANVGSQVAFALDGQVQSAPMINQRIDGDTQITGAFTEQTARDLAASLTR